LARVNQITHQKGVGLIEILVSLLIVSVGLLGVASLQFIGSFNNTQSVSRTQAELVARQLSEQFRSAAIPATSGDGWQLDDAYLDSDNYNFATLSCNSESTPYVCYCLSLPEDIPDCRGSSCSVDEMASYSGWTASCNAVQINPNTELSVTCTDLVAGDSVDCSGGSIIHIMVSWPINTKNTTTVILDSRCSMLGDTDSACVIKDVTL
jgi:type IV pilus assembly protein PilV